MTHSTRRSSQRIAISALSILSTFALPAKAEEPKFGGTLRIASLQADLDAFDPLTGYSTDSWEILRAVTRQLVTYPGASTDIKDDTQLVPDLATSWDVSADGKTYTFHLKDDVFFSGPTERKIVASDFVYGIKRFCDPNKQVAAINYFNLAISGFKAYCEDFSKVATGDLAASKAFIDSHDIAGVSAPDEKTLVIKSDTKNYDFLNILSMNFVSPLPPEISSKYFPDSAEFRKNFPSSGPYFVESYQDGQKLILKKAKNFKAESDQARKAYVDEIVVDFTANSEDSIVQKIEAGEADLSLYLDVPPRSAIRRFQTQKQAQLHASNSGAANFITFNARPEAKSEGADALRKLEVRQALSYAVNRAHLVQIQGGPISSVPLSQIITSTILGHEPFDPYPTEGSKGDPAKAKELLAKAGYPKGLKIDAIYRTTAQFEAIAVAVKEDVAAAGIDLNLIPIPPTQWYAFIQDAKSRWDISLGSQFAPDWQGPSTRMLLGGWLNSDASPCGTGNVSSICYSNTDLNTLAAEAFPSDNPGPIWAKADKIVSADLPWIPLFEKRKIALTSERITHWAWSSLAVQADITNIAVKN
ncbi:peptide/nickel transport system substrate-binding protein [Rhizobium sp. PP-F2F-G38]|nr:peptide/nickel transport system substrate-binding protein [Rhizobium sp. PP-F2F-G38]TCL92303.1 peptide/nickel transport system substrate-binding protein [Rhizobium sp. PP-WC-2G-219]TCP82094.1 peptide/nickel transport system substrate-binding protein [Rhizobium sp. PP-CC-2G-626]TCQ05279.1 peptide/nickel transport system substrate-binding protein [Rhizobium sp. PP-F2F-G36]